jgi:acyl-CoA thioesterase-1
MFDEDVDETVGQDELVAEETGEVPVDIGAAAHSQRSDVLVQDVMSRRPESTLMLTRWLVFHIASGQSFFTGAACLIVAVCLTAWKKPRAMRMARNVLVCLGGIFVFVSAAPLSPWFYLVVLMVSLLWLAGEALGGRLSAWLMLALRVAVVIVWVAAVLVEWPYHLAPRVPRLGHPVLGIIGDSITAGMGEEKAVTWPRILADRHGVMVHDHSLAGANVASALRQAASVSSDERLVLLEIGGNDILGETTPAEFASGLARLLSTVRRPGRVVVMLELPLPPTYNAYGRAQRRLARHYQTLLVPRRVLLGVLQRQGTTLDTIHLSGEGHQVMADAIWKVVGAAYEDEKRLYGAPGK